MTDKIRCGLDNPHHLSQMKTELIWEGNYDGQTDTTGRKGLALLGGQGLPILTLLYVLSGDPCRRKRETD